MLISINRSTVSKFTMKTRGNKSYLVAPVVMIVEGVLNGEMVPQDEFGRFPEAWNGIPLTIDHPRDNHENPISANSPEVEDQYMIGRVYGTYVENGKLMGEIHIDLDLANAKEKGREIVNRIKKGEAIEVSTGYFRDIQTQSGTFKEVKFATISRNIRPDHLAVLPDDIGACSIEDGCGVRANTNSDESSPIQTSENLTMDLITNDDQRNVDEEIIEEIVDEIEEDVQADEELEETVDDLEEIEEIEEEVEETVEEENENAGGDSIESLLSVIDEAGGVDAIKELLSNHNRQKEKARNDAIKKIVQNNAKITPQELEPLSTELLEKLAAKTVQVNTENQNQEDRDEFGLAPPVINFSLKGHSAGGGGSNGAPKIDLNEPPKLTFEA